MIAASVSGIPDTTIRSRYLRPVDAKRRYMSTSEVWKKIGIVELALQDAGTEQALNAVTEVLKEIAKTLDTQEKAS